MTKPIYENRQDFENEQRLADFLAVKWKCEVLRQKRLSQFDFIAHRGEKPLALLEFRKLRCRFKDFPSVMISMTKLVAWHSSRSITGLPCYFVVEWADRIGFADMDDFALTADFRISKKSANRRNDYDDQEIVAHLPTSKFKIILDGTL